MHLDGSTSSDPDGTIASYRWFNQQQLIGSGPTIDVRLPDGDTAIRLEVTDNDGATGSSTATISVETPNGAPTARIKGGNRTIPDSDRVAGENVHLDGSTHRIQTAPSHPTSGSTSNSSLAPDGRSMSGYPTETM